MDNGISLCTSHHQRERHDLSVNNIDFRPVRLAYQPRASSTFLSEQTSHQQPASSTFLSEQISTSHLPLAKRNAVCRVLMHEHTNVTLLPFFLAP
jgi:hypothetical protein